MSQASYAAGLCAGHPLQCSTLFTSRRFREAWHEGNSAFQVDILRMKGVIAI